MKPEALRDLLAEYLASIKRQPKDMISLCDDFIIDMSEKKSVVSSLKNAFRKIDPEHVIDLATTRDTEKTSSCLGLFFWSKILCLINCRSP